MSLPHESQNHDEWLSPSDRQPTSELLHHPSLKDMAADYIRKEIVSGRLAAGEKVDQDEVAKHLGISRLPVREALIELTAKGYVTSVPRRGAFVVKLEEADIVDHFEVLSGLFALTARRAATNISDEQIGELQHLHDELLATRDRERDQSLNVEFYRILNRIGSSDRLLMTLRFLALALPNDYYMNSGSWRSTEASYRERLLVALEARDPEAAGQVTEEHLRTCGKLTVDELQSRGYWSEDTDAAFESREQERQ